MDNVFFIPYAVPSSKNGRVRTKSGLFIASKATQKYRKLTKDFWIRYRDPFKKFLENKPAPYIIGFHFVRGTRHDWDFINPAQTIQDEMVAHGWIEDDNSHIMLPVPLKHKGEYWSYNKSKPGVYIAILDKICDASTNIETSSE